MSKVKIQGNASGTGVLTITAPNTSTDRTITLPDSTGTILDNTSTLDATKLSGAITTSSLVVNGTNADLTLAASGNNISFARNSDNYITASGGSSSNLILDGQNRIVLKHNGTEKLRVTTNGLTFNGDTAAANALDDYEKGSWTPQVSLNDSTTVSGLTQDSGSNGVYTKIGNVVTVHFYLGITAKGTTTSGAFVKLEGLPFTVANSLTSTSLDSGNGQISYYSGTSGIHGMSVVCVGGGTTAFFYRRSTSDTDLAGRMDNNDILNNFNIRGTITYQST